MNNMFILDLIFPKRCCGCDKIIDKNHEVCDTCKDLILHPSNTKDRCDVCFCQNKDCLCSSHIFYDKIATTFIYTGTARKTLFKMKFRGRLDFIKSFARMMANALNEREMTSNIDIITFIPMRSFSKFKRGYNQAELLANELSSIINKPCKPLLEKLFSTSTQHSLDSFKRSGNLLGAYEPIKENLDDISNKTILIVDDIITTGNTVNEAAKTLLIFGASSIYVSSCAVTSKRKKLKQHN